MEHEASESVKEQSKMVIAIKTEIETSATFTAHMDSNVELNHLKQEPGLVQTVKSEPALLVKEEILENSSQDVQKKWKSPKDTYRKELKKIPVSRSGDAAITDVEVKWKYFKLLSFIKDEIIPTDSDSNLVVQEGSLTQDAANDSETLDSDAVTSEEPNREQQDITELESDNILSQNSTQTPILQRDATQIIQQTFEIQSDQPMPSPTASTSTNNSARPKKRQTPADLRAEYLEIEKKKLRMMELELSRNISPNLQEQKSEDYHFVMSILPQIERLPPIQKMRLRNKINQVVIEEMEIFAYGAQYGDGNFGYNTGSHSDTQQL